MSSTQIILGRYEAPIIPRKAYTYLSNKRILITGAAGSLGEALREDLIESRIPGTLFLTDKAYPKGEGKLDCSHPEKVADLFLDFKPQVVFHLAAAKHAPLGEDQPWETVRDNVVATYNIMRLAHLHGCRSVLASTCKAADPETVYGSTKLIAERMALNLKARVARFYNVPETSGNVFRLWEELVARGRPIQVMPCQRYFISQREAVSLLLECVVQPTGRYAFNPGDIRAMRKVAEELYPDHPVQHIAERRGDRKIEKLYANCERFAEVKGRLYRITSPHDPIR